MIHHMLAMMLPKIVQDIIDPRRRTFLLMEDEKYQGSQCLIAWDRACLSKDVRGMGICSLEDQNHCIIFC